MIASRYRALVFSDLYTIGRLRFPHGALVQKKFLVNFVSVS